MQAAVIIPNHNYGNWVADAITSAIEQTFSPKRIVIIDDGSTDTSLDTISSLLKTAWDINEDTGKAKLSCKIDNIEVTAVHWKKALGPSFARNYGIGLASKDKGVECYAFLDSDDYYETSFLKKTTSVMEEDPEYIGVVYTDSKILNIKESVLTERFWEPFDQQKLLMGNRLSMNSLVNRKSIDAVGLFDTDLRTLEDWDLWLRIAERFVFVHVAEFLVMQRNHGNNTLDSVSQEKWLKNRERVLDKAYSRMKHAK